MAWFKYGMSKSPYSSEYRYSEKVPLTTDFLEDEEEDDERTLYPERVDLSAARCVSLFFISCTVVWLFSAVLILCLAILPEAMRGVAGDFARVPCRVISATQTDTGCRDGAPLSECDSEPDPHAPTPGEAWKDRCSDSVTESSCTRNVWVNALVEWQRTGTPVEADEGKGGTRTKGEIQKKEKSAEDSPPGMLERKLVSVCYQYRCSGGLSAKQGRRKEAETRAETFKQAMLNESAKGRWLKGGCVASETFYSMLPNLKAPANGVAIYFHHPSGYLDLPGGITLLSVFFLVISSVCTVAYACCAMEQCRKYAYANKSVTGHVL